MLTQISTWMKDFTSQNTAIAEDETKLVINEKSGEKWFFAGHEDIRKSCTFEIAIDENSVATPQGIAMAI